MHLPSAIVVSSLTARLFLSTRATETRTPVGTLADAKLTCNTHQSVCGIAGREDTSDFECVDTRVAVNSCGGCIAPHPFYEPYRSNTHGMQCGHLPGVISARCSNSKCVVRRCGGGYKLNAGRTKCIAIPPATQQVIMNSRVGTSRPEMDRHRSSHTMVATDTNGAAIIKKISAPSDLQAALLRILAVARRTSINSALEAKITGLVYHVTRFQDVISSLPLLPSYTSSNPPDRNIFGSVAMATANMAASATVADLITDVEVLANVVAALDVTLNECEYADTLVPEELAENVRDLSQDVRSLKSWLLDNTDITPVVALPGARVVLNTQEFAAGS